MASASSATSPSASLVLSGEIVFRLLGFAAFGLLAQLITATVGAIILLWLVSYLRRK